jgi:hypothetical protein
MDLTVWDHVVWKPPVLVHAVAPPATRLTALSEKSDRLPTEDLVFTWWHRHKSAVYVGHHSEVRHLIQLARRLSPREQSSTGARVWSVDHKFFGVPCRAPVVLSAHAVSELVSERDSLSFYEVLDPDKEVWLYLELVTPPHLHGCQEQASTARVVAAAMQTLTEVIASPSDSARAPRPCLRHGEALEIDVVVLLLLDAERVGVGRRLVVKPHAVRPDTGTRVPIVMENVHLAQAIAYRASKVLDGADAGRIRRDVYEEGTSLRLWRCRDITAQQHMICDRIASCPVPSELTDTLVHPLLDALCCLVLREPSALARVALWRPAQLQAARDALPPAHVRVMLLLRHGTVKLALAVSCDYGGATPSPSSLPPPEVSDSRRRGARLRLPPERLSPLLPVERLPALGVAPKDLVAIIPKVDIMWIEQGVRSGVHAKRTTIAPREQGLFAPKDAPTARGALLALVHGEVTDTPSAWAMAIDDGVLVGPTKVDLASSGTMRRWLASHWWACINEPPERTTANATIVAWYRANDVIEGAPPSARVLCWAVHAAETLDPGTEIFLHYGNEYEPMRKLREYRCGSPAVKLKKSDIPHAERPALVFGPHTLKTAIFM